MLPTRPIGKSLTDPPPFDPPRLIQETLGGRQFFFDIGARAIHRVGLLLGLGWRLPFGEAADAIDFVQISVEKLGQPHDELTFEMQFYRIKRFDADGCTMFADIITPSAVIPEAEMEQVRWYYNVPLSRLRQTYDAVANGQTQEEIPWKI